MATLRICTYNVRNDNLVKDLTPEKIKNNYHRLIREYKINILCTQEMIKTTIDILKKQFHSYHMIGNYRYGSSKLVGRIGSLNKFNEGNQIITNLPVYKDETTELPWFPRSFKDFYKGIFKYKSVTPRIVTETILEIEGYGRVRFLNTHLDCHLKRTKLLQLNKLRRKINSSTIPVVLTGDFNTDIKDKVFLDFINDMEKQGLKLIEFNDKTFKKSRKKLAIDHIFIPSSWEVTEIKTIDEDYLDKYSDHYPLLATVIPKK